MAPIKFLNTIELLWDRISVGLYYIIVYGLCY